MCGGSETTYYITKNKLCLFVCVCVLSGRGVIACGGQKYCVCVCVRGQRSNKKEAKLNKIKHELTLLGEKRGDGNSRWWEVIVVER